jgi:beta-xylosidase
MAKKKKSLGKKEIFSFFILLFLLISLTLSLNLIQKVQIYLGRAFGKPANIIVDVSVNQGPIMPIWQALAQGGEEQNPFDQIIQETRTLQPKYIRIDHLYDTYVNIKKENNQITFDWTQLDQIVNQILQTGAIPFFSLSYMPPAIAQDGEITNPPANWHDWLVVVRETIEHYSGRQQRNLQNVIYEVWNEPDLFGNWKVGRGKNYCLLYHHAAIGASEAQNTNSFKIGGPSTTAPYQAWVDEFLDYVVKNNLRLDFYSWHRYSLDPQDFLEGVDNIDSWLFKNAGYSLEKYITEWGSYSENSPLHDGFFDAAHLVATTRQLIQRVDLAFSFEIKDGPDPAGKQYWGRWGLLTHETAGPITKKPRYYALNLLNRMVGRRLRLEGEGTWVTGFAAREGNRIKIILANLDRQGSNSEKVPVTFENLEDGQYQYQTTFLAGPGQKSVETAVNGTLSKEVILSANNVVVIELAKI